MNVRMALHFHKLEIDNIKIETQDSVSISFCVGEELVETFAYKAGQYLTFRAIIDGKEVRRSYSLCSSPLENEWKVTVKKVPGGKFSTFANDVLKAGDSLDVMKPIGNFTCAFYPKNKKNYLAFASGSGITPIISLIKTCLETEPASSFTLFYGNKTSTNIIFKEELEALKNLNLDRFRVFYIFSQEIKTNPLFSGRIDRAKFDKYCNLLIHLDSTDEIFLCGPGEMIFDLKDALLEKGIDHKKIHFELFTTPDAKKYEKQIEDTVVEYDPEHFADVTIKLDGNTFEFKLGFEGESILNKALSLGADLPYACKGGVCSTCRAKLIEGKVVMDANYSLESYDLDNGFILTCQSHPRSDKLFVDYDHN